MAKPKPYIAGRTPIKVELKKGETYAWCSCGSSSKQPFCDGSHQSTQFLPEVWKCTEDKTVHLCTCKMTDREHGLCNGAHKRIVG